MADNIIRKEEDNSDENSATRRYKNKHKKVQMTKQLRSSKHFTKASVEKPDNNNSKLDTKSEKSKG